MATLLIATRNTHKVGEIRAILGDSFHYLTLKDFPGAPEVIEDADTFAGNATKKANQLARWISSQKSRAKDAKFFILADDSGLEVDALKGAPGVHSARFAALDSGRPGNSSDVENCAKLLRLMQGVPMEKRTARFRCVLALTPMAGDVAQGASPVCYADELELQTTIFDGACEGKIIAAPRGQNGFGYDPLFIPDGHEKTFGELAEDVKNKLSHRAKALAKLKTFLAATSV